MNDGIATRSLIQPFKRPSFQPVFLSRSLSSELAYGMFVVNTLVRCPSVHSILPDLMSFSSSLVSCECFVVIIRVV